MFLVDLFLVFALFDQLSEPALLTDFSFFQYIVNF